MGMRKSLIGIFFGFIVIAALALNATAQMHGCMDGFGGGMPGGKMECMEHQGMDMMQGMGGMQGCGMMMGDDHPMMKHIMDLSLDEKQKEAFKALRSKTMKDMIKKRADKQIAGVELRDLLGKDVVDMKAVEASVKKNESLRTEMFLTHIRAHEEMKSILTPEQRKRLKEMMAGRIAGCAQMGGDAEHKDMPMHEHMH
jgi:Spy/CpxP family protein refolding chaperone